LATDETISDLFLVDVFEDVRRVNENAQSAADGHRKEDVELQTVDNHCDVSPVVKHLRGDMHAVMILL